MEILATLFTCIMEALGRTLAGGEGGREEEDSRGGGRQEVCGGVKAGLLGKVARG